jgi:1,5-anhydro-D-fructose reductase (1,5-anhydro-D-mannitol-forming)
MTTGILGWGIIGIGNIVRGTIAPALVTEPSCEIVAAVSRDQSRVDAFAAEFGVQHGYTDYDAMLANPEVEAVFIATPNAQHAEQVVKAALAGKHVLCDKPLATTVDDAIRAVDACESAGVRLGINLHNRYLPWVRDVRDLIASGAIGEVMAVHTEVGSGPRTYTNWRADPKMAGLGSVFNVGVHAYDFVGWILDAEPVEVSAMFEPPPSTGSVEMLALSLVRFGNGVLASFNTNERVCDPQNDIVIHGTTGRIVGRGLTRSRSDGAVEVLRHNTTNVIEYPAPEAHRLCVAAYAAAVLEDREPSPSGHDGLRSVRLSCALALSAIERRHVFVTEAST